MAPSKPDVADASAAATRSGSSTKADDAHTESSYESTSPSASEDETSSSGEDSDEDEGGDQRPQAGDDITTLPRPGKPQITNKYAADGAGLMSRLSSFLPQLAAANASLEEDRAAGRLEERSFEIPEGTDKEHYIEMDLGLGVLEEKHPDATSSSGGSDDEEHTGNDMDIDRSKDKDSNIMGHLMGQKNSTTKPKIEDLGNG
ncbi:hypothetical protein L228DRAFT_243113 [Xylona heveae TC161]|uniref:Uncharacterized protein n=1 Tax=Xylona heveae (strain CBS 132557 / TC161) TaxID=1328760 RepID=A0A165JTZ1_XYLHT|nr:hypothetical protein L228DRAFT_243113 [Xylona heveae TC161]KZF26625.1 hypothetical protein L228DRAFT_243113 [Xylona heveae TC161]